MTFEVAPVVVASVADVANAVQCMCTTLFWFLVMMQNLFPIIHIVGRKKKKYYSQERRDLINFPYDINYPWDRKQL